MTTAHRRVAVAAVTPAPETMTEILAEDVAAQTHRERSYPLGARYERGFGREV
jgi:hypothetical protein